MNFKISANSPELACHCCGRSIVISPVLIGYLNAIAGKFGPIYINSGYRCPKNNARTAGAARDSKHVRGMAADFRSNLASPKSIYTWCDAQFPKCGLIRYRNRIHIDVRDTKYRLIKG